ncbi:MAG: type 4a pilus biogenesis protein PilO [Burkholderiaceae bacterium]
MANVNLSSYVDQFRNLNTRDVSTWPIAPRVAAILAIVALVLLAGWYFYWSDQLAELQRGQDEETALKVQYKDKLQQAVNLEPLRKQRELATQYVARLEKQLPSKSEMDALLSDINQAGIGRGLQFELFRPGQAVVRDYYAELPISIRLIGTYHDIAAFTSDIANLPRIVTLNNLSIVMPPNGPATPLALEAIAKTFRYLDPEEVQAQRKAPKAAR